MNALTHREPTASELTTVRRLEQPGNPKSIFVVLPLITSAGRTTFVSDV